mgnify:CR=1 FL=1
MKEPIRILSDLHLGHKVSRINSVAALRPLIAGAGTIVFNGDTWQELAVTFRERSTEMLGELRSLCAEEGAEMIFLSGNHDPGWQGNGWLELAEGKIVITHGDALLFDGSPWKREILVGGERVLELWRRHPTAQHDAEARLRVAREIARELSSTEHSAGKQLWQRAWDAVVPPQRALKIIQAWFTQARSGAEFCARYFPQAEVLIIGHFHHQGCWQEDGRMILNTGSFMNPGRAHWVEWNHGWLSRGVINETRDLYQKGEILDIWRI